MQEKKKMHIVGEEGVEVYVNWVIISTSVGQAEQCYQSVGAALPLEPGGTLLQMSGLLRAAFCPTLIPDPLGELERSRAVSEHKLQTNITIHYSNFFSPLLFSSMDTPGWLKPQQTDPLDKDGKDGRKD